MPDANRPSLEVTAPGELLDLPVRVDLHNHTRRSGDGRMWPFELLERAAESGIHCLAVTDHNSVEGALECLELSQRHPDLPRVIPGMEICTAMGELVALYVTEDVPLELRPEETVLRIHELGGLAYLPHPFDHIRRATIHPAIRGSVARIVDIVEVRNGRSLRSGFDRKSMVLAADAGKPMGAGSDAHYVGEVGRCYVRLAEMPERETLLDLLRRGRPIEGPERSDRLRAWRYQFRTGLRKIRRRTGLA